MNCSKHINTMTNTHDIYLQKNIQYSVFLSAKKEMGKKLSDHLSDITLHMFVNGNVDGRKTLKPQANRYNDN